MQVRAQFFCKKNCRRQKQCLQIEHFLVNETGTRVYRERNERTTRVKQEKFTTSRTYFASTPNALYLFPPVLIYNCQSISTLRDFISARFPPITEASIGRKLSHLLPNSVTFVSFYRHTHRSQYLHNHLSGSLEMVTVIANVSMGSIATIFLLPPVFSSPCNQR